MTLPITWPDNYGSYFLKEGGSAPYVDTDYIVNQGAYILGDY